MGKAGSETKNPVESNGKHSFKEKNLSLKDIKISPKEKVEKDGENKIKLKREIGLLEAVGITIG